MVPRRLLPAAAGDPPVDHLVYANLLIRAVVLFNHAPKDTSRKQRIHLHGADASPGAAVAAADATTAAGQAAEAAATAVQAAEGIQAAPATAAAAEEAAAAEGVPAAAEEVQPCARQEVSEQQAASAENAPPPPAAGSWTALGAGAGSAIASSCCWQGLLQLAAPYADATTAALPCWQLLDGEAAGREEEQAEWLALQGQI